MSVFEKLIQRSHNGDTCAGVTFTLIYPNRLITSGKLTETDDGDCTMYGHLNDSNAPVPIRTHCKCPHTMMRRRKNPNLHLSRRNEEKQEEDANRRSGLSQIWELRVEGLPRTEELSYVHACHHQSNQLRKSLLKTTILQAQFIMPNNPNNVRNQPCQQG